jgi:hypothetical protein
MAEMVRLAGIDVSKETLDVCVAPIGESRTVAYDEAGLADLGRWLIGLGVVLVALEASGGMYLLFTDQTNDTYSLSLYSSKRKMHTVSYNSDKPAIWKIQWSNTPFSASAGHTLLTPSGKKYETSLDIR